MTTFEVAQSLPVLPEEYTAADIAIADAIVDDWRAEHDPTPLTFDHLRAMGWHGEYGVWMFRGDNTLLFALHEKTHNADGLLLGRGDEVLEYPATLGGLRSLERVLCKQNAP